MSLTALAAYAKPDDADARREANQALASLRDASDRLQQMNAAAALAEQQEAATAETLATAERHRQKDRLIRDRDRLQRLADIEAEKGCDAYEALPAAEAKLADLERQWRDQQVVVDVLLDRFHNASDHNLEYAEQVAALDAQIAAFPVTAADVAAHEADEQAARDAARAARLAKLTEETDQQLRDLYDNEVVETPAPARERPRLGHLPAGETIRLPRHRVASHERDMAEAVAWLDRQEKERLDRARRQDELFERNLKIARGDDEPTAAEIMATAKSYNIAHGGVRPMPPSDPQQHSWPPETKNGGNPGCFVPPAIGVHRTCFIPSDGRPRGRREEEEYGIRRGIGRHR